MNIGPAIGKKNVHDVCRTDCGMIITQMSKDGYKSGTIYQMLIAMMELFKYAKPEDHYRCGVSRRRHRDAKGPEGDDIRRGSGIPCCCSS